MAQILTLLRKRMISSLFVLLIVVVGCFLVLETAPGDAVDAYAITFGGDATAMAQMRARWGLDQSIWHRLWAYLAALAQGNLGWSVSFSRPILDVVLERLPKTLMLMGMATAVSFSVGSVLGIVAGSRPGSFRDRFLSVSSLILYAIPSFFLALVLVIFFSIKLRWLPSSGIETIASDSQGLERVADIITHLILPVTSLSLVYLALYLRVMRASMAEIWQMDFVRALRARGISRPRIVLGHVARNALLPLITMLGLQAAAMLGGSVVIESVFAIPGLGRLAQEAVAARDTPLLLGVILTSAIMVILVNFLVDLIYFWLDPRILVGSKT
ncbi:ABC transporter permease [Falsochrobactrum ovis]|uniref:Peptide/nickel transport system permease protein n=1 Tax=Falsochrobactrum ovis TaxID=1293442 RepID=A0A364JS20_9HYPH|nr:ABC transporter permease [Falsochrobactrum ovis]RAK25445.1 peptide/nickel transport system permease protein [Falsochrobactrum ovis]